MYLYIGEQGGCTCILGRMRGILVYKCGVGVYLYIGKLEGYTCSLKEIYMSNAYQDLEAHIVVIKVPIRLDSHPCH